MLFIYLFVGWEGSAADSFLFEKARATSFAVPEGCYYLADAGFPSCDVLLVPYRGVRYHLREWGAAQQRYAHCASVPLNKLICVASPQNHEELFNLRHAQARNVIERIFDACKRQFPILGQSCKYDLRTQNQIWIAFTAIFTFYQIHDHDSVYNNSATATLDNDNDNKLEVGEQGDIDQEGQNNVEMLLGGQIGDEERAEERRDRIAMAMWESYQVELERRGHIN